MRVVLLSSIFLTAWLLSGCTETDDAGNSSVITDFQSADMRLAPVQMPDASVSNILSSHHEFSFLEFQQRIPHEKNALIAPFDTQQFLATLALGAEAETLTDISTAAMLALDQPAVYEDISVWEQSVSKNSGVARTSYLWGQSGYLFDIGYLTQQAELFGPVMRAADFRTDTHQAQTDINTTLATDYFLTNQRSRLVSAQITDINSVWSLALLTERTQARFGYAYDQQWIDTVRLDGILDVYQGPNYKAVQVPFNDSSLALLIVTPGEGSYTEISAALATDFWNQLIGNLSPAETQVYVPEISLEREMLAEDFPALGFALSDTSANFSVINNAGFLYLQQPKQTLFFSLGETGLSSQSKNVAVHTAMENEPEFVFNNSSFSVVGDAGFVVTTPAGVEYKDCFYSPDQSPFIFALYDKTSKTILNLGQIKTLEGEVVTPDWQVFETTSCGDSAPVEIYKYKGSRQCESNSGVWYGTMQAQLTDAGIEVVSAKEANDNLLYAAVCGGSDGVINVFGIRETQLEAARALGFNLLSELPQ